MHLHIMASNAYGNEFYKQLIDPNPEKIPNLCLIEDLLM